MPLGAARSGLFSSGDAIPNNAGVHYYVGDGSDIEYYTLPDPYDLDNKALQTTVTTTNADNGICFDPTGTRAVIYEGRGSGTYSQYDLTTAWDLSSLTNETTIASLPDANFGSIQFGDGGSRFYITDTGSGSYIEQYDLSTAYDISTASSTGSTNLNQGGDTGQTAFNSDGTKLIWAERRSSSIYSTPLSTAFDITTTGSVTTTSSNSADPAGVAISYDGSELYTRHYSPDVVERYTFGTTFDISTLTFQEEVFTLNANGQSHQFSINPWQ